MGRMFKTRVRFALALALAACCACGEASRKRPTVVLVTLDTTRADHLSTYGYDRPTDPFLRSWAKEARVFEAAFPSATWTLPSHVSLLSGLDPAEHGCWRRPEEAPEGQGIPGVSPSTPLLTDTLVASGYHALAAVGGPFTSQRYGLLRGFHGHLDPGDEWELSAPTLNRWIFEALEQRPPDRPLFLFVNYFDAHAPYDADPDREYPFPGKGYRPRPVQNLEQRPAEDGPVPPDVLRDAIDQYDRELWLQDEALGQLFGHLEALGLFEDALVIVTADHGEMFGERPGLYGHGCVPYEPVARVPLLIRRLPGGPADRVAEPVSLTSVPRTVLETLGLPLLPGSGAGPRRNLLAEVDPGPAPYVEHRGAEDWVAVLRGPRLKYGAVLDPDRHLEGGREFLVDLEQDPGELNLHPSADGNEAGLRLRRSLAERVAGWSAAPTDLAPTSLSESELEGLRALGYAE